MSLIFRTVSALSLVGVSYAPALPTWLSFNSVLDGSAIAPTPTIIDLTNGGFSLQYDPATVGNDIGAGTLNLSALAGIATADRYKWVDFSTGDKAGYGLDEEEYAVPFQGAVRSALPEFDSLDGSLSLQQALRLVVAFISNNYTVQQDAPLPNQQTVQYTRADLVTPLATTVTSFDPVTGRPTRRVRQ